MFERLAAYDRICVTGPQRSGTTICAHMIAHDTGYPYVDEDDFGVYDTARFDALTVPGTVTQCPAMFAHLLGHPDGRLVVMMHRPLPDIGASAARIAWDGAERERAILGCAPDADPAARKYDLWGAARPADAIDVDYGTLARHPLWVDAPRRAAFTARQWVAAA